MYQVGTFITTGAFGKGFVLGLIAVAVMISIITYMCVKPDKSLKASNKKVIAK